MNDMVPLVIFFFIMLGSLANYAFACIAYQMDNFFPLSHFAPLSSLQTPGVHVYHPIGKQ